MRITENRFLQFETLFQVLAGIQKKREHVNVMMTEMLSAGFNAQLEVF